VSRLPGDREFTREQFLAALAAAHEALGPRRGRWSEIDLAATMGMSRRCLFNYRRIYGVPRAPAIRAHIRGGRGRTLPA
jgi:hypothetical protein